MYTVFNTNDSSEIYGRGMSAEEAMSEILRYDGHDFTIELEDDFWVLRGSTGSRYSMAGLGRFNTITEVLAANESEATAKIAEYVVSHSGLDWSKLEAMEDSVFDEMLAEIERQNAE
ncbi:MAG: hypothetical protein KDJ90_00285 [Nitratireductor sp.]|nr:hypothetical protein [Nitratireductor sp.]